MALNVSRGYESDSHRQFMRMSVLLSEALVYFTGILYFVATQYKYWPQMDKTVAICFMLMQPAVILIDHGHFQYVLVFF